MGHPMLTARLLGPPELSWGGERLAPRSRKGTALLLYLAVRAEPVGRERLAELLWGPNAYQNVRQALLSLRRLAGAGRWLDDGDPLRLRVHSDLTAFRAASARGDHGEALRHWGGPLLHGFELPDAPPFGEWLEYERARLDELHREALRGHAGELEACGEHAAALQLLHELVALDPLDESAHRGIIRLEYHRGHVQAALAQFERCRRTLLEELGVGPLTETLDLVQLIQGGGRPLAGGTGGDGGTGGGGGAAARPPDLPLRVPRQLLRPPQLVGRRHAWARMEAAWQAGQTIFVSGPAGVGKTRLMMDFVRAKGDYLLLQGRPGDALVPYSVMARALALVDHSVPDLDLPDWVRLELARIAPQQLFRTTALTTASKSAPESGRAPRAAPPAGALAPHLQEAFMVLMRRLRTRVAALPADDVQYFDRPSSMLAEHLTAEFTPPPGERLPDGAARMVVAFRDDEAHPAQRAAIEASVELGHAILVQLEPLAVDEVAELVHGLELDALAALEAEAGAARAPGREAALAERLHRYTGGNPSLIVETLKDLHLRSALGARPLRFELPQRASLFLKRRLDALSSDALRLVRAAAVAQPHATPELLGEMLETGPMEVAEALGELEEQQLLSSEGFVHDLVYEAVLRHTPAALRRLLHRRAAQALERLAADPAEVARHWLEAGEPGRAVTRWLDAAGRYRDAGLFEAAQAVLEQAASCAAGTELEPELRAELAQAATRDP